MNIVNTKEGWVVSRRWWIFTQYLSLSNGWMSYFWPSPDVYHEDAELAMNAACCRKFIERVYNDKC